MTNKTNENQQKTNFNAVKYAAKFNEIQEKLNETIAKKNNEITEQRAKQQQIVKQPVVQQPQPVILTREEQEFNAEVERLRNDITQKALQARATIAQKNRKPVESEDMYKDNVNSFRYLVYCKCLLLFNTLAEDKHNTVVKRKKFDIIKNFIKIEENHTNNLQREYQRVLALDNNAITTNIQRRGYIEKIQQNRTYLFSLYKTIQNNFSILDANIDINGQRIRH